MLILPAIDLRGGRCVRLKQGDYNQETIFGDDPVAMAKRWVSEGAKALHLVDLDGAKAGQPVNGETVKRIAQAVDVPVQVGGGFRTAAAIAEAFTWGVARVILGTKALQDPAWVREMAYQYPQRMILGLDARNGMVATHGWLTTSETSALDVAREFAQWPLYAIVYTDIAKDGMMAGPNVGAMVELAAAVPLPVIASGGVTTIDDVRQLKQHHIFGAIIGRSLYEGQIDLAAAIELVESPAPGTTTSAERPNG